MMLVDRLSFRHCTITTAGFAPPVRSAWTIEAAGTHLLSKVIAEHKIVLQKFLSGKDAGGPS
jgi:hypothetical protein